MIGVDALIPETAARDEQVIVYPGYARMADDGSHWRLQVHGAVLEQGEINLQRKLLLKLLRRVMKSDPAACETELFRRRVACFTTQGEAGRRIEIRIGDRTFRLPRRSKRNGHFQGVIRVGKDWIGELQESGAVENGWLAFQVAADPNDTRVHTGRCRLVEPTGVSVISDIDDTIKHTEVASRRALLANTFLHEFRAVGGMSDLYQQWAANGAVFHYVSSSPWQLFEPLHELCAMGGFPAGSMHLRLFRLRDHMLRRVLLIRRRGKKGVIRSLLRAFPGRRFVLVGDSGERDPEIYAELMRRHPQQIAQVLIRDLDFRPLSGDRFARLLRRAPRNQWRLFREPSELPPSPWTTAGSVASAPASLMVDG